MADSSSVQDEGPVCAIGTGCRAQKHYPSHAIANNTMLHALQVRGHCLKFAGISPDLL